MGLQSSLAPVACLHCLAAAALARDCRGDPLSASSPTTSPGATATGHGLAMDLLSINDGDACDNHINRGEWILAKYRGIKKKKQ